MNKDPEVKFILLLLVFLMTITAVQRTEADEKSEVSFVKHTIGDFRSEACNAADFNGDGRMEVIAGPYLYLAPEWDRIKIRELDGGVDEEGDGYYHDFANLPLDVDRDGSPDLVTMGWFIKRVSWFRNTIGNGREMWPKTVSDRNGHYEMGQLADVDGDGKEDEILPHTKHTIWYDVASSGSGSSGLVKHVISQEKMEYGAGAGDVNGDGRNDLFRPNGWFEAPADPIDGKWTKHTWSIGAKNNQATHTPEIHVLDVNADGLNDVITSDAHGYGIFWYEQRSTDQKRNWIQHTIDDTWSQPHSLSLGDIDRDGDRDLVTGKRYRAHNGKDPGANEPLGVYWYEFRPGQSAPWKKHKISYKEGIGASMNTCLADLDDDGDIDIVVTGKWGGPVWFENRVN